MKGSSDAAVVSSLFSKKNTNSKQNHKSEKHVDNSEGYIENLIQSISPF